MPVSEREVDAYTKSWINTPEDQFAAEFASLIHETKRISDPYVYIQKNGELFSPTGRCKVKDTIADKTSYLGQLEYQAVLLTEQWAASRNEGAIVWISPSFSGVLYPTTKVIISQIEQQGAVKRLFNRAILFDFSNKECFNFAQNLARYSQNRPVFVHLDQVRATPLFLNTHGNFWINIFEELIDDPVLWQSIRNGEDIQMKKETLRQAAMVHKQFFAIPQVSQLDEAKMAILQMLGTKSPSCPPGSSTQNRTAFQVFSENSITYAGSGLTGKDPDFCKSCPVCGKEINCVVRMGGSCPECGAVKRCG